jgi:hypothetical protein
LLFIYANLFPPLSARCFQTRSPEHFKKMSQPKKRNYFGEDVMTNIVRPSRQRAGDAEAIVYIPSPPFVNKKSVVNKMVPVSYTFMLLGITTADSLTAASPNDLQATHRFMRDGRGLLCFPLTEEKGVVHAIHQDAPQRVAPFATLRATNFVALDKVEKGGVAEAGMVYRVQLNLRRSVGKTDGITRDQWKTEAPMPLAIPAGVCMDYFDVVLTRRMFQENDQIVKLTPISSERLEAARAHNEQKTKGARFVDPAGYDLPVCLLCFDPSLTPDQKQAMVEKWEAESTSGNVVAAYGAGWSESAPLVVESKADAKLYLFPAVVGKVVQCIKGDTQVVDFALSLYSSTIDAAFGFNLKALFENVYGVLDVNQLAFSNCMRPVPDKTGTLTSVAQQALYANAKLAYEFVGQFLESYVDVLPMFVSVVDDPLSAAKSGMSASDGSAFATFFKEKHGVVDMIPFLRRVGMPVTYEAARELTLRCTNKSDEFRAHTSYPIRVLPVEKGVFVPHTKRGAVFNLGMLADIPATMQDGVQCFVVPVSRKVTMRGKTEQMDLVPFLLSVLRPDENDEDVFASPLSLAEVLRIGGNIWDKNIEENNVMAYVFCVDALRLQQTQQFLEQHAGPAPHGSVHNDGNSAKRQRKESADWEDNGDEDAEEQQ